MTPLALRHQPKKAPPGQVTGGAKDRGDNCPTQRRQGPQGCIYRGDRHRAYILDMAGALFVRVSADTSPSINRTFEIWIVATDDRAEAERAVRAMVSPGRSVEVIHDLPSAETIKRLALPPGKAWLL